MACFSGKLRPSRTELHCPSRTQFPYKPITPGHRRTALQRRRASCEFRSAPHGISPLFRVAPFIIEVVGKLRTRKVIHVSRGQ